MLICAVVNYRRSILDLMSKSKTKKDRRSDKAIARPHDNTARHAGAGQDAKAQITLEVPKLKPLGFKYGAELVRSSLKLLKDNYESCLIMFLLPSLLLTLGTLLAGDGMHTSGLNLLGAIVALSGFCWYVVSMFAGGMFSLAVARGQQPGVRWYYARGLRFAPRLIGLSLLLIPLIVGGLLLLILPGLIVIRRYSLAYLFLVDRNLGIREAMDMSAAHTKAEPTAVFGVATVLVIFLVIAGAFSRTISPYGNILALIVQVLYVIAPALLYVELQKRYALLHTSDEPLPIKH